MKALCAFLCLGLACEAMPAEAQSVPDIALDNPRIQRVHYEEGASVLLTMLPGLGTTVVFDTDEYIERVTLGGEGGYSVRVSPEGNSLLVLADQTGPQSTMVVETDVRHYTFVLRTGDGILAGYLVQFTYGELRPLDSNEVQVPSEPLQQWSYRLRGDRVVYPQSVRDDGRRTYITYHSEQALPAVFAIGPTGDEELVNGHMRGEDFVIDRVYAELVFRLDDERARAVRNGSPDPVAEAGG